MQKLLVAGATFVAMAALQTAALASSDNPECVTSTGQWNAPFGSLVVNKSSGTGPVSAVITSIGEYFTHSATSQGPNWGSMTTMQTPRSYPSGNSSCGAPAEPGDLANGWPGARTDNTGGLWGFYFGGGSFMNGQTALYYIVAGSGTNYAIDGSSATYGTDLTVANCLVGWEGSDLSGVSGCGSNSPGPGCSGPFPYGYSVYAYTQVQNSPSGYGTMCSGLISRAYYWGKSSAGSYCTPNSVSTYTYSNSQIVQASNGLYNNVTSGSQGFWGTLGACVACFDCNLLDEAGDQVVDCFTNNQGTSCGQSNHDWAGNGVYGHTATSISPDRLYGTGVHYPTANTKNTSPWAPYGVSSVQFNQPGNVYGCWY